MEQMDSLLKFSNVVWFQWEKYIRNVQRITHLRGLLEKYPTFGRKKETGLLGALDT